MIQRISLEPTTHTPVLGGVATLRAEVTGSTPMSFQWLFGGAPITGATNAALSMENLRLDQTGYYSVRVSNSFGIRVSAGFLLNVSALVIWGNEIIKNRGVPVAATNVVAVATSGTDITVLRADGTVVVRGLGQDFPELNPPASVSNVVSIASGGGVILALKADGRIVGWGWNYAGLKIPPGLSNIVAIAVGGPACLALRNDGTLLVFGENEPARGLGFGLDDVVAIAPYGTSVTRSDGTVVNFAPWTYNGWTVPPEDIRNVAAVVSGYDYGLAIVDDGPPRIFQHPIDVDGILGGNARLIVNAIGAPPLHYQWRVNGVSLAGATNAVLALDDLSFFDEASYDVVVANARGAATSRVARVTIRASAPFNVTVQAQPQTGAVLLGGSALLSAHAEGTQPFAYQWLLDDQPIFDSREATLRLDRLQASDAGNYSVIVANAFGTSTSAPVHLTVTQVAAWGGNDARQLEVPPSATNVVAIAAGARHGVALRADGTVAVWGNLGGYNGGALQPPPGLSDVVAVAAGDGFNVALKSNGRVTGWGAAGWGQFIGFPQLSNIIAVAVGYGHTLALRADGTVFATGLNNSGQLDLPPTINDATAIAAQFEQSLVLRRDGTVVMAGAGGNFGYTLPPVPAEAINVAAISSGQYHALALRRDGTLLEWGTRNGEGVPRPADLPGILAIAAGAHHDLALLPGGRVVAWGGNWLGQATVPAELIEATAIAAGYSHSLALVGGGPPHIVQHPLGFEAVAGGNARLLVSANGTQPLRYQWRRNGTTLASETNSLLAIDGVSPFDASTYDVIVSNALGAATSRVATVTVSFAPPSRVAIACEPASGLAFLGGTARFTAASQGSPPFGYQWHFNDDLLLATRTQTLQLDHLTFADSGTYSVAVANPLGISTSAPTRLNVVNVAAWGNGPSDVIDTLLAVPASVTNAVGISASIRHALVLRADGTSLDWGSGGPGFTPAGASNLVSVAAGYGFSVGLRRDGTVIGWHNNAVNNGGAGPPPAGLSNVIQLVAGEDWAAVVKRDGTVTAWGRYPGVLKSPLFAGRSNVVQLAAGSTHALALLDDGTVLGAADWNSPESTPPGLSDVVTIAACGYASVALLADGTIVDWGREPIPPPAGVTNVVAVTGSHFHRVALREDGTVLVWRLENGVTRLVPVPPDLPPVVAIAAHDGVTLAVIPATGEPHVAKQPRSQRMFNGERLVLESSVFPGATGVTYQWFRNGVELLSQTNAVLEFASVTPADAGWYSVRVSNPFGADTSREALVTIREQAPEITRQPANVVTSVGSAVLFEVGVAGSVPLAFQWFFGGAPLPGATNASLILSATGSTNAGTYYVVVQNSLGIAVSQPANLRFGPILSFAQTEFPVGTNGWFTFKVRLSEPLTRELRVSLTCESGVRNGILRQAFLLIPAGAIEQCATMQDTALAQDLASGTQGTLRLVNMEDAVIRPPFEALLRLARSDDLASVCDPVEVKSPRFLPGGMYRREDGAVELSFSVDPGRQFTVEGSTDLRTWQPVSGTYALDPTGTSIWFLPTDDWGWWWRPTMFFYRIRLE